MTDGASRAAKTDCSQNTCVLSTRAPSDSVVMCACLQTNHLQIEHLQFVLAVSYLLTEIHCNFKAAVQLEGDLHITMWQAFSVLTLKDSALEHTCE
jgi:hypothetical protein